MIYPQIHDTVQKRDAKLLQKLLAQGGDVNARDSWQRTPLIRAAERDWLFGCEILLEHKADINAVDVNGRSALIVAAARKRGTEIVSRLVDSRAELNLVSYWGYTALGYARMHALKDNIELLGGRWADGGLRTESGQYYRWGRIA